MKSLLKYREDTLIPFYLYESADNVIIRELLLQHKCEFYAKLNNDDQIVITVTNGTRKTLCKKVVTYEYFYKKFKKQLKHSRFGYSAWCYRKK